MFLAKDNNGNITYFNADENIPQDILDEYISKGWVQVSMVEDYQSLPMGAYNIRSSISWNKETNVITLSNTYDTYTIEEFKVLKGITLKTRYIDDIKWTDDCKLFYDKWKLINPSDTSKDSWWSDVLTYWNEARTQRETNKSSLTSATTMADVFVLEYQPIHTKTKAELDI